MNNPLVQPDPGLYIWTIATFLILVVLLAKFAWKPLLAALEERQAGIRSALAEAQLAREEIQRVRVEAERLLTEARVEGGQIIARTREDAERLRAELKQKAQADAAAVIANAEKQIQLETTRALEQVRREAVELSVAIASKLLQRNVSVEDNARLIQDAVADISNAPRLN
ncbi:MAG: F0F1 ATP synthase subunit B [Vicinamibacterales bacterium]